MRKYPNEPEHKDLNAKEKWENENLSTEQLIERGWGILDGDTPKKFDDPTCRFCKHFHGKEKGSCSAYPNGIPDRFAFRTFDKENKTLFFHTEVQDNQTGSFVFLFNPGWRNA